MNYMTNALDYSLILSQGEQLALLRQPNQKAPTGLRNLCMIMLMLKAGLRAGEVLALKVDDIYLKAGKVHLAKSGAAQERTLWLDEDLMGLINKWLLTRPHHSLYLFTTLKGERLKDRYLREMVKRLARKAGLNKDVHPHLLRSTFAVQLIRETNDIRLAQNALGHRDISTTQAYVKHLFKEHSMAYYDLVGFRRSGIPAESAGTDQEQTQEQARINPANKNLNDKAEPNKNKRVSTLTGENKEKERREGEAINNQNLPPTKYSEQDNLEKILNQTLDDKALDDKPGEMEDIELRISMLEEDEEGTRERTLIPALKCSHCTYILHYQEDCPRCGATFKSILEYWRKYR